MHAMSDQTNKSNQAEVFEGLVVNYHPAPFAKRMFALCIDLALIGVLFYAYFIVFIFVGLGGFFTSRAISENVSIIFLVAIYSIFVLGALILNHGYFIYFEAKRGTTPGKQIFGLSVRSLTGTKITVKQAMVRESMRYVDLGLIVPGLISIAVTDKKQRLGDMLAGTFIVHSVVNESRKEYLYITRESYVHLRDLLKPKILQESFIYAYLQDFSYLAKSPNSVPSLDLVDKWSPRLKEVLDLKNVKINSDDVFIFMAEHCHQLSKGMKNGK